MDQLLNIPGVGDVKATSIYQGVQDLKPQIKELAKYVTIEQVRATNMGKLSGKSFVFTGKANHPRKELEAMVTDVGGEVRNSVSAGTTYLVTNDPTSGSSKNLKAQKLGTIIITEQQFIDMVGK
jgi:DNA ligase (NAD+)